MQEVRFGNYWRKTKNVKAIRITQFNIELVWRAIGAYFWPGAPGGEGPTLTIDGSTGYIGYWAVEEDECRYTFLSDDDFLKEYETHSERQNKDERYAKIFQIVVGAMTAQDKARFYDDSNGELELVAEAATRKILGEL